LKVIFYKNKKLSDQSQSFLKFFKDCAHSAHVTGLLRCGDYLVSSSVDQRVSVWKMDSSNPENPLVLVSQRFIHVPDVHDMTIYHTKAGQSILFIVGAGIQLFEIKV
jgi:hypothetical protein